VKPTQSPALLEQSSSATPSADRLVGTGTFFGVPVRQSVTVLPVTTAVAVGSRVGFHDT
jgi:hypothetical protein